MGNTAYSLDGSDWVELPVGPRWGGQYDSEQQDLELTTERGVRWIRRQFDRQKWVMTFRVTAEQLEDFRTLHQAVDGQSTPFYFSLDYIVASPIGGAIYGRKEAGFAPGQLSDETEPPTYDYVMTIIEEIDPLTVLA